MNIIIIALIVVATIIIAIFRVRQLLKYGLPAKLIQKLAGVSNINRQEIAAKIADFKSLKKIKKLDQQTIDLQIVHRDNSIHWYRVKTNGEITNPKILSLNKYS